MWRSRQKGKRLTSRDTGQATPDKMFDIQLLLMLVYLHNAASMSYLSNISYVHALSSLGGSINGLPEVGNGEDKHKHL